MISQTKKAKEVRKYFIEMEKLVKRYAEMIKDEMYKKIGLLETNQKSKLDIKGGVIYILKALNANVTLYKLGKSTNLKNRLNTYNSGNANDIEPLFILPVNDIDNVESCIKKSCKLYQYRKYKEVYEIDINVLKDVMTNKMASKLKDKITKKMDKYFIYLEKIIPLVAINKYYLIYYHESKSK